MARSLRKLCRFAKVRRNCYVRSWRGLFFLKKKKTFTTVPPLGNGAPTAVRLSPAKYVPILASGQPIGDIIVDDPDASDRHVLRLATAADLSCFSLTNNGRTLITLLPLQGSWNVTLDVDDGHGVVSFVLPVRDGLTLAGPNHHQIPNTLIICLLLQKTLHRVTLC